MKVLQGCGAEPRCPKRTPSEQATRRSGSPKAYPNCSYIDETLRTTQLPPYCCTRGLVLCCLSDHSGRDGCREGHIVIPSQGHCWGVVFGNWIHDRVGFGGICDSVCRSCQYARFPLFLHPVGARLRTYRFLQSMGDCDPSQSH